MIKSTSGWTMKNDDENVDCGGITCKDEEKGGCGEIKKNGEENAEWGGITCKDEENVVCGEMKKKGEENAEGRRDHMQR